MTFQSFLVCCTAVICNEVDKGLTQKQIAQTYAMAIVSDTYKMDKPDWTRINNAIIGKWGIKGLERIKKKAWKLIADKARAESGQNL